MAYQVRISQISKFFQIASADQRSLLLDLQSQVFESSIRKRAVEVYMN